METTNKIISLTICILHVLQCDSLARKPKHSSITSSFLCGSLWKLTWTKVTSIEAYIQQDGATRHTSNARTRKIGGYFGDRLISKNLWPPRSPDLTPPDLLLWGLLKGRVYSNKPRTSDALKDVTWREVAVITDLPLPDVFVNLQTRIQKCLNAGGGHFQHMP
jgi:hypothetical protein